MKSNRIYGLLALACLAIASPFTQLYKPVSRFASAVYRTYKRAKDWLVESIAFGFNLAAGAQSDLNPVSIRLAQAKAFVMRLAKRERPELTGSWRMCPST